MVESERPLPAACDVVVIGAGVGGLTAAAILSKAGVRTVVFEAGLRPGGYLCSFRRNGFTFDTSVQWLTQCRPGGFVFRIHRYLGDDGPRCEPMKRIRRFKFAERDYLLTSDPLQLRDRLMRDYPDDAPGILALFKDAEMLGRHMRLLDNRLRSAGTMSQREKARHGLAMTRWVWPIRRFVMTPADKGLARYFRSRELREMFQCEGTLMSVLVPLGFAFTGDFQMPPKGGCDVIVERLCRTITAEGGAICTDHPVKEVLVAGRQGAAGVRLRTGEEVQARYVVAACDVETLFGQMVPHAFTPARWRKRLREADLFASSFSIYAGLDCDPASLGLNEELIGLAGNQTPPGDARRTAITVLSPSRRDPSLAPQGKGTLLVQCPAYLQYQDNWQTGAGFERGEAYRRLKHSYADVLLDRVERDLVPDLRRHIEVMEIATPVTFWRYTGNRDGSIMGHRPTRRNIWAGLARVETPVRRLLLGGQWAEYGGGVPMATKAAVNASLMILGDLRPPAAEALASVVDGTVPDR